MNKTIAILTLLMIVIGGRVGVAQTDTATTSRATNPRGVTPKNSVSVAHPPQKSVEPLPPLADSARGRDALLMRTLQLLHEQQRFFAQRAMFPPQSRRAPAPPVWLLPLLIVAAAASLLAAALHPLLHRRSRAAIAECARSLPPLEMKIDAGVRFVVDAIQKSNTEMVAKVDAADEAVMSRLTTLFVEVGELKERVGKIAEMLDESPTTPSAGADAVRLEHQVLAERWRQFREKKDLDAPQDNAWEKLLDELSPLVPADLRGSFDAVLTPYREHRLLIQKIGIIPHVFSGKMRLPSEAAELKRARDLTQLLISSQSADGNNRLQFAFQTWVTDTFLPFADLYLQRYQKAELEQRDDELQKGMSLIREILRLAAVEPIDVTLGETRFDSVRHIGRFTSSDPQFPDGVITGVVRNGFVDAGRQVIRQPEVIVNRIR